MKIIDMIIDEDKKDFKCYEILKNLLNNNLEFAKIVEKGIVNKLIFKFPDELWEKIKGQNIRRIDNFMDVFRDGANIGYCTVASKQLSYSLSHCYICGGVLPILDNTFNCDGSHTWISYNGYIIDTSLMLIISEKLAKEIGYQEENRYDPNMDPVYLATKEWTNDKSLKR